MPVKKKEAAKKKPEASKPTDAEQLTLHVAEAPVQDETKTVAKPVKPKTKVASADAEGDLPLAVPEPEVDPMEDTAAGLHAAMSQSLKDKLSPKDLMKVLQEMQLEKSDKKAKEHTFWNTQPVPQDESDQKEAIGEIETKTVAEVAKEPYPLPEGFMWTNCDMSDPTTVDEAYTLLYENYVEDDDNLFRFDYSREFLQWALKPPGFIPDWHVGVRLTTGKKKLMGFITGVPAEMSVYGTHKRMAEINFLCVHKKLRSKRLAPVLIKEITRRVNLTGVWQAVYTAGVVLPKPVAKNRYYHRSLNPKKLIEIGFSHLQARMTLSRTQKLYKLPPAPLTSGLRPLEKKDVPVACRLLNNYLSKFGLHQTFSEGEFEHALVTRPGVVYSWVVEEAGVVTDMCSFYSLPSTIIGNKVHSTLRAAYSFYNFSTKTPWQTLMTDALILARDLGFDVFNALNVMENVDFLVPLKFGVGDGHLQYYLYNWRCPEMPPKEVGLVLL
jgi:glycylpeptide N-tetradecanoyltransferase